MAGRPDRLTLADVAERAGVSRATVSLVLRSSPLVAESTRIKVQRILDELGYVYNRSAASMRASRSRTVGLLVPGLSNPFFAELAAGVDQILDEAGLALFLADSNESVAKQERVILRMREHGADGIIICPAVGTTKDLISRLDAWKFPFVQALRHISPQGDYAGADYEIGMDRATEHLIRLGHRRIAFVGGEHMHSAYRERRDGFVACMRRHGLSPDFILKTPLTRQAGMDAVAAVLEQDEAATAAICFNDVVAFGMLLGLSDRGLEPGVDLAVVGFDDVAEASLSRPPLTTVATLPNQIGQDAARLLLRRIADPHGLPERVILPTRLVVRASCGALRSQRVA
ncbi:MULTISPECIES: LacI family DNA-binding transcriptional regulator [Microvirga]|uniref:LacI family DNA-binding transcriptional regulator n=1 Tax=Microvirga TaxID=186650 RepID=UPI0021C71CC3|nr:MULTISPECIES: LacI family DNA-binding transcriptional regulator [unclassified Microvirga]